MARGSTSNSRPRICINIKIQELGEMLSLLVSLSRFPLFSGPSVKLWRERVRTLGIGNAGKWRRVCANTGGAHRIYFIARTIKLTGELLSPWTSLLLLLLPFRTVNTTVVIPISGALIKPCQTSRERESVNSRASVHSLSRNSPYSILLYNKRGR